MKTKNLIWAMVCLFLYVGCFTSQKEPVPRITEEEKRLAIDMLKGYEFVRDASISQKEEILSLAVIVNFGTSKNIAKEMGDNFVRLVKSFSKDEMPEKLIGEGIYDYMIGVYYPNEEQIVFGVKVRNGKSISW